MGVEHRVTWCGLEGVRTHLVSFSVLDYPLSVWSWTFCLELYCFTQMALNPCPGGTFTSLALTARLLGQLPVGHLHLRVVFIGFPGCRQSLRQGFWCMRLTESMLSGERE